ncbi:transcriptional regulator, MarR family [Sanguibacter gelidistatuariae]|uniref:Transcriptional regulator, MarR family n=1 Tax=Sanguibacter gelidistatuariae TaxID=1814289 RepID=A0A1G6X3S3_9MICO|nr:MarR family transcriptional regulator [Sanguibacter gelidistatuariae]SDD72751.1 transcriptional regulator, MarR family [Sanguibacter gelidistatuariae]
MATETPEIPWLSDEQQVSWRAFLEGASRLSEALNRDLEGDSGLSLNEYEVLVRLSENSSWTMRMSHLADSLAHSRSRVTHTVRRLEERGLVNRESCVIDGRGINAVLTDAGYAVLSDAAPKHVRSVRRHLVDVLTAEQLAVLGEAMERVAEACRD